MSENEITPLKFVERILDERQRQLELTAKNLEHRLDSLNALRNQVLEDRMRFVTIDRYETQHKALEEKLIGVSSFNNKIIGAGTILALLSGIIGGVMGHFLK